MRRKPDRRYRKRTRLMGGKNRMHERNLRGGDGGGGILAAEKTGIIISPPFNCVTRCRAATHHHQQQQCKYCRTLQLDVGCTYLVHNRLGVPQKSTLKSSTVHRVIGHTRRGEYSSEKPYFVTGTGPLSRIGQSIF